jgi:DNA-binding response OmpR family regulator
MENKKKISILLVEDDPSLGYLLKEYLGMKDFQVTLTTTAKAALKSLEGHFYDLAILDVMLVDGDGFELAKSIRSLHSELPFIFLTARSLKVDVLKGFSIGALDYLKKPIDEEELVVRIKSLLTRLEHKSSDMKEAHEYAIGIYRFHVLNQRLEGNGKSIALTKRESELLKYLITHQNNLCTHKEILTQLWGKNDYFNKKSLNVFISHLRKYLQDDPSISIENIHKQGFILKIENA